MRGGGVGAGGFQGARQGPLVFLCTSPSPPLHGKPGGGGAREPSLSVLQIYSEGRILSRGVLKGRDFFFFAKDSP